MNVSIMGSTAEGTLTQRCDVCGTKMEVILRGIERSISIGGIKMRATLGVSEDRMIARGMDLCDDCKLKVVAAFALAPVEDKQ